MGTEPPLALLTLHEYPDGLTVERQRLILGIARQLRSHLQDELRHTICARCEVFHARCELPQ